MAVDALNHAEQAEQASPDAPYARATIHVRLGQIEEAAQAAQETLRRNPAHTPSAQLLRQLGK